MSRDPVRWRDTPPRCTDISSRRMCYLVMNTHTRRNVIAASLAAVGSAALSACSGSGADSAAPHSGLTPHPESAPRPEAGSHTRTGLSDHGGRPFVPKGPEGYVNPSDPEVLAAERAAGPAPSAGTRSPPPRRPSTSAGRPSGHGRTATRCPEGGPHHRGRRPRSHARQPPARGDDPALARRPNALRHGRRTGPDPELDPARRGLPLPLRRDAPGHVLDALALGTATRPRSVRPADRRGPQ